MADSSPRKIKEPPILITYKGRNYDVTGRKLWKDGRHMGLHRAGRDLTAELAAAPHGEEVFNGLTVVGDKPQGPPAGSDPMDRRRKLYYRYHPHPTLAHLPLGTIPLSLVLQLIFLGTKDGTFEMAAFYSLAFAWFGLLLTFLAGLLSWWINYELAWKPILKKKLLLSLVLLPVCGLTILVRFHVSDVSHQAGFLFFFYHLLFFSCLPLAVTLGYYGSKLTWPDPGRDSSERRSGN